MDPRNDWIKVCFHQEYWPEIYDIFTNLSVCLINILVSWKFRQLHSNFVFKMAHGGDGVTQYAPHKYNMSKTFHVFGKI